MKVVHGCTIPFFCMVMRLTHAFEERIHHIGLVVSGRVPTQPLPLYLLKFGLET